MIDFLFMRVFKYIQCNLGLIFARMNFHFHWLCSTFMLKLLSHISFLKSFCLYIQSVFRLLCIGSPFVDIQKQGWAWGLDQNLWCSEGHEMQQRQPCSSSSSFECLFWFLLTSLCRWSFRRRAGHCCHCSTWPSWSKLCWRHYCIDGASYVSHEQLDQCSDGHRLPGCFVEYMILNQKNCLVCL